MKLSLFVAATMAGSLAFGLLQPLHAAPTDFDQDGKSDLVTVSVESNGSLKWTSLSTVSGQAYSRGTFGTVGNHITLSNWTNASVPEIGVVSVDSANALSWKIMDENGTVQQRILGREKNIALAGGDFNGNGIGDAAIAKVSKGKVIWNFSLDMFARPSQTQIKKQTTFGTNIAKIFYARARTGRDWLGAISKSSKGKILVQFKDLLSGKILTSKSFPSFVYRSLTSLPIPLRQANGTDILGFSRVTGGKTRLDFYRMNGTKITSTTVPVLGDVIVGDFTAAAGQEVAVKSANGTDFFVFNPLARASIVVSARQGIAVDNFNVNPITAGDTPPTVAPVPTSPPSAVPPPDAPPSGNPNFPGKATQISCTTIIDIDTLPNLLYKNENLHGGRGRSWLDQGHRLKGVRTVLVAGLDGYVFGCFGLYRCDRPFGCRYYQQQCGDPSGNGQFINLAKAHSSGTTTALVTSGNGACYQFRADESRDGNIIK